jgi:UDP-GlcNAc:undecaprenyl-phosphate GlcNAc-1-phosphate transferase
MSHDQRLFLLVIAAFSGAALLTPVVRRVALRRDITDKPAANKHHVTSTPYLGGVAISLCVVAGSLFLPGWKLEALVIIGAAVAVACVGLVDDIRNLGPLPRVAVEVVASSVVFVAGARVSVGNDFVDYVLTVTWLVVLTNAFNLLDNMDGCAGVVATVTASALAVAALLEGQVLVGGLAVVVAATCLGFLVHNWHPARIFMGDAGSLFLGFLLSTIALKLRFPVDRVGGVAAVILLAGPAVFDTTLVVMSRLRAHRKIFIGGVDHTSHRLRLLGVPQRIVPVVLGLVTGVCGAAGILIGRGTVMPGVVFLPVVPAAAIALWLLLKVDVYGPRALDAEHVPLHEVVAGPGPVPALTETR